LPPLSPSRRWVGLERARSEGKRSGRKALLSAADRIAVREAIASGISVSQLARDRGTSRQTIMRAIAEKA
jgi:putative DNA-invertase from lambdoid prophage Rac